MDFSDGPAEAAFRQELRGWLGANLPAHRARFPPSDGERLLGLPR